MKANNNLLLIFIIATFCSLVLIFGWGVIELYDSASYIKAWDSFSDGHLDALRTPVYPFLLHLFFIIFGSASYLKAIIVFQHIIFLLSVLFFNRLLRFHTKSERTIFWLSLLYALLPCFNSWNNCILTESLALSGSIFLLYLTSKIFEKPSLLQAFLYTLQLLFLLFLRPIFLYMLPVLLIASMILFFIRKKRRSGLLIISGTLASCVCICIYMKEFHNEYGLYTTSSSGIINQYYIARQYNILDPSIASDASLKEDINRYFLTNGKFLKDETIIWDEATNIVSKHKFRSIQQCISESFRNQPLLSLTSIRLRLIKAGQAPLFFSAIWDISSVFYIVGCNLSSLFLFLLLYSVFLISWIIKKKSLPWNTFLCYLLGVSSIIISIIGAQNEWNRLILPSMPIWGIMVAQVCSLLHIRKETIVLK